MHRDAGVKDGEATAPRRACVLDAGGPMLDAPRGAEGPARSEGRSRPVAWGSGVNALACRRYAPAVDCVYDDSLGEDAALTLGEPSGPQVRLWNRVNPWADGTVKICAQLAMVSR